MMIALQETATTMTEAATTMLETVITMAETVTTMAEVAIPMTAAIPMMATKTLKVITTTIVIVEVVATVVVRVLNRPAAQTMHTRPGLPRQRVATQWRCREVRLGSSWRATPPPATNVLTK